MDRRLDDPNEAHFSRAFINDRFFVISDGWYYESRLLKPYGPFESKQRAEQDCQQRFSGERKTDWTFS